MPWSCGKATGIGIWRALNWRHVAVFTVFVSLSSFLIVEAALALWNFVLVTQHILNSVIAIAVVTLATWQAVLIAISRTGRNDAFSWNNVINLPSARKILTFILYRGVWNIRTIGALKVVRIFPTLSEYFQCCPDDTFSLISVTFWVLKMHFRPKCLKEVIWPQFDALWKLGFCVKLSKKNLRRRKLDK